MSIDSSEAPATQTARSASVEDVEDVEDAARPVSDQAPDTVADKAAGGAAEAAPPTAAPVADDTKAGDTRTGDAKADDARAAREARKAEIEAARAKAHAEKAARVAAVEARMAEAEARKSEKAEAIEAAVSTAPPPVPMARPKQRHLAVLTSFVFVVLLPALLTGYYLWNRAADQYASNVGFSVRTEEAVTSIESILGVTGGSGSSSSDTDILYEFLQSQEIVAMVDAALDLRTIWSRPGSDQDPVFSYRPPGTIEDLTDHWARKVKIYYDSNSGLIDLRVLAFRPEDATRIAEDIYDRASTMINQLSAIAREDAIGYAREELDQAESRLKEARLELQAFRNRTQIIDPSVQGQTQSGIIGALESQLAEAQIELGLLRETVRETDPRIPQTELRIEVIRRQIAEERNELGVTTETTGSASVADLVGQYEALAVDLTFAQEAYTAARASYDAARNEARRQSRYLAAHVNPTTAEKSQYPDRQALIVLITLFLFLFWAVSVLIGYALRDRR